jgi:hypothetical protein
MTIIKLIGNEVILSSNSSNTTLSSVQGNRLVRVFNQSNAAVLITQQTVAANGTVTGNVGSATVGSGETLFIEKTDDRVVSCQYSK